MEGSTQNREHMLAQIRSALGRGPLAAAPEPLAPFAWPAAIDDRAALVEQFSLEVQSVGGIVARPGSAQGVREYLSGVLAAVPGEPVAISDGELARSLGTREWLLETGRRVVPTLREFREFAAQSGGENETQTADRYKAALLEACAGITSADYALADTGTLVIMSGGEQHRLISLLPPTHICLLDPARILPGLTDLLALLREQYGSADTAPRNLTCITGPSRTADIEQTITLGVHGPKSLHVVLYSPEI